jgi:hypothetical protein
MGKCSKSVGNFFRKEGEYYLKFNLHFKITSIKKAFETWRSGIKGLGGGIIFGDGKM